MSGKDKMRAIFIVGPGRSGSTILGKILGTSPGVGYLGETGVLWSNVTGPTDRRWGLDASIRCGCGEPLMQCPVWTEILDAMVAELSLPSNQTLGPHLRWWRDQHEVRAPVGRRRAEDLIGARTLAALYCHAATTLGCSVIVDSTKDRWTRGLMALLISGGVIEADVVHLVRDPRATTYSWQHRVHTNDGGVPFFNRRGTLDATRHWVLSNLQSSVLRRKAGSQHAQLLRYEDLMAAPQNTLGLLFSNLGLTEVPQVEYGAMALPVSHTLYGNPSRFQSGRVILEVRQEWLGLDPVRRTGCL
jgi:hypothetical protein